MAEARTRRYREPNVHHGSPWPVVVAIGAGVAYVGLIVNIPLLVLGLVVFVSGALGWLRDDLHTTPRAYFGPGTENLPIVGRVSARKLATWLFLATEVMFFSAIIGAAWTVRLREAATPGTLPWATSGQILNVPGTAFVTFILICSSLTMVEALAAIDRGDLKRMRYFLAATMLLGITFLAFQANEFYHLYFTDHLTFTTAPFGVNTNFGPAFFIQTGTHGAHVTAGVLALAYLNIKAWKGGFTKENHETIELVGLYWHFVDVVWIFLFTLVYLI